jgi:lysophospholipase
MKWMLAATMVLMGCGSGARPIPKGPPFDFDTAVGPGPEAFSSEADLLSRWNDTRADSLKDFWNSGEAGTFDGVGGVKVAYRIHRVPNAKAAVVITPGRTEAIIKYAEVARDLTAQGYSTYAVTLRGQGEAGRMLPDANKGYVDYFDDYVEDTHTFVSTIVKKDTKRVFVVAHSLGGAVVATVVDEHPEDFEAVVLSAPMLEINPGAFPPPLASSLGLGVCNATDGTGYAIGSGPYQRETDFPNNTVTTSEARWTWKLQQLDDDESIRLGGLTWRWLCQALIGSSRAQNLGTRSITPTVILQPGDDTIVKPGGQNTYCRDATRCTLSPVAGARHEILQERDPLRNEALSRIVKFFNAQVNP